MKYELDMVRLMDHGPSTTNFDSWHARPAWPALEAHPMDHLLKELRSLLPRLHTEGRVEQRQGDAHQAAVPDLSVDAMGKLMPDVIKI